MIISSMCILQGILADVTPTTLHIMSLQQPKEMTVKCLIKEQNNIISRQVLAAQSNLRFEQKRCLFPKNSELDSVFLGQSINNLYFCTVLIKLFPFAPKTLFESLRLGIYSQAGTVMFPGWECFIPKVGTKRAA